MWKRLQGAADLSSPKTVLRSNSSESQPGSPKLERLPSLPRPLTCVKMRMERWFKPTAEKDGVSTCAPVRAHHSARDLEKVTDQAFV